MGLNPSWARRCCLKRLWNNWQNCELSIIRHQYFVRNLQWRQLREKSICSKFLSAQSTIYSRNLRLYSHKYNRRAFRALANGVSWDATSTFFLRATGILGRIDFVIKDRGSFIWTSTDKNDIVQIISGRNVLWRNQTLLRSRRSFVTSNFTKHKKLKIDV